MTVNKTTYHDLKVGRQFKSEVNSWWWFTVTTITTLPSGLLRIEGKFPKGASIVCYRRPDEKVVMR